MGRKTAERRPRRKSGATGPGAPALHASVAQMRALAHPLRLRVLELFAEEPRTTMQVARLLGEPPTRLYHHVNALDRAGLLRLRETRAKRGTTEKWYEAVAHDFSGARSTPRQRGRRRALTAIGLMVLEQARRELHAALAAPRWDPSARLVAGRLVAVGSRAHIAAVRRRLMSFARELRRDHPSQVPARGARGGDRRAVERWSLTLVFAPTSARS